MELAVLPEVHATAKSTPADIVRSAYALFCDDIRHENTGKLLMVGVYGDVMALPEAPVVLPSLCVFITLRTPLSHPLSSVTTKLLVDDQVIYQAVPQVNISGDLLPSLASASDESKAQVHKLIQIIRVEPFVIEKACVVRVRIETESEVLSAGSLRVIVGPLAQDVPAAPLDTLPPQA